MCLPDALLNVMSAAESSPAWKPTRTRRPLYTSTARLSPLPVHCVHLCRHASRMVHALGLARSSLPVMVGCRGAVVDMDASLGAR